MIVAAFLDLKRAFETVDRSILLEKLKHCGIGGRVLSWFRSWLSNRTQRTQFRDRMSDPIDVNIGIPQGTPLSCLLFNIFFNDIVEKVQFCEINLFADDVLMWIACDTKERAIELMNCDISNVFEFFVMSKLMLNINKSKVVIFGGDNESDSVIQANGQQLEVVNEIKYLGVVIDNKLNFKSNTNTVIKKMSKKIGFLRRNSKKFDFNTRLLLYKSIKAPHIDYCSSVLFLCNEGQMTQLQRAQNRALRAITRSDSYDNRTN